MSKEIYISSTPHETRLAIVEKEELSEIYYERENEYTLAGSIYNGRVTRVLPGMQSAFVDVGLERDAFLYITDFLEEQGEDSAEFEGSGEPRRGDRGDRGGERSGERSGRGERGRGGDRDRGGRDRGGSGREVEAREARESAPVESGFGAAEVEGERPEGAGEEETGEGSRRWRGRRGRRRGGRSGGEERGPLQGTEESIVIEGESAGLSAEETGSEPMGQTFSDQEPARGLEFEAAAESGEVRREREGRGERGGRGRGGRERGGRERGGRAERAEKEPESGGVELQAGAEPFILPGESLSRYRRGEEPEAARVESKPKATVLTSRPSTEINLAAGWDGGMVLPGETLSRRGGAASASAPAVESAGREERGGRDRESGRGSGSDRRRERDRQRGRGGRGEGLEAPREYRSGAVARESLEAHEAVQPGVSSGHEPEVTRLPLGEVDYEPVTDVLPVDGPSPAVLEAVAAMHEAVALEPAHAGEESHEFQEETREFEPGEEASASYRVDPVAPSEFRQAGAAEDVEDVSAGDPAVQEDYAGTEHQYTTIGDAGEMLSELPGELTVAEVTGDPTNPIEHETAVLTERASELLGESPAAGDAAAGFAPGEGVLEEELMDEDETEALDVAASYGDDTEEETFEAGAEIGALVRDRALDEITEGEAGIEDEEEDDFDIDEEEMEEDELEDTEEIAASDVTEAEDDDGFEGPTFAEDEGGKPSAASMGEFPEFTEERPTARGRGRGRGAGSAEREPAEMSFAERGGEGRRRGVGGDRDRGGRDRDRGGRDSGRDFGRDAGRDSGRDRRGMAGSRSGGRNGRHSMQTTDLPAISDLLKPGQEVLVQIAKEPIAKKGARITSHIALPGRFLVFMPTVNHVGVSRKIESDGERRRLKEILLSEKGEAAGGFIVRTAASGASEEELRSDLRFLLNLWSDIKSRSESSKSPALIYHDLNLVERILRDQVSENFSAIWCDTENEYERVLRFLQRFEPSLMRRVKLYTKDTPLFEQFGISEEINKALRSKVWLKSGGSIVINQTEALVAIDINTGKYVGKTARLEDTIVKTNLDAIPEIVRQVRLRDLGGIIVIDFIDMDDRRNRQRVLLALEEELKNDRAPSKVLQFNDFGLVAITRKRVKQSLERTLSTTCGVCAGTGMVKSPVTVCNEIYVELRKMHKQLDKGDVMLRVNPEVVKQLKSNNARWLQEMEEIAGKTILVKSDPSLHPEQFDMH